MRKKVIYYDKEQVFPLSTNNVQRNIAIENICFVGTWTLKKYFKKTYEMNALQEV